MIAEAATRFEAGYRERLARPPAPVQERRPMPPAPPSTKIVEYEEAMREWKAQPLDIRFVDRAMWLLRWVWDVARWSHMAEAGYRMARSFVLAHRGGFVIGRRLRARKAACAPCAFVKTEHDRDYCGGEKCNCGQTRLSQLDWKRRLAAWKCPQGRFEE